MSYYMITQKSRFVANISTTPNSKNTVNKNFNTRCIKKSTSILNVLFHKVDTLYIIVYNDSKLRNVVIENNDVKNIIVKSKYSITVTKNKKTYNKRNFHFDKKSNVTSSYLMAISL